ncbi:MAG: CRISPR-associated protein [Firmicutes bacterium]|nr:CRISPR-associated protein [Bacillota bacterium]
MAKVLISPLGVGKKVEDRRYPEAVYRLDLGGGKGKEYRTPFVAAALATHLNVDRVFLIGTAKSMWEEVYRYFANESGQDEDMDYWYGLGDRSSSSNSKKSLIQTEHLEMTNSVIDSYLKHVSPNALGGSRCYITSYGIDEGELWNNFDIFMSIGNNLDRGDEVYLDITHSFRSIPLFMYLMMDFIQTLNYEKEIKLAGIYYGMLEANGEFGYAPVVDLSPLFNISLWARGVYNFINYGNGYLMADLIEDDRIRTKIKNISELVNINYLTDLKREIDSLEYYINNSETSSFRVFKYLMPYLGSFIKRFKGINSNSEFQFELARWYFENKRYSSGYICLAECIVTRIAEIYKGAGCTIGTSKDDRDKIKRLINNKFQYSKKESYRELNEKFKEISEIRNDIAHAGYLRSGSFEKDIGESRSYLNSINKLVFNNGEMKQIPKEYPYTNF